MKICALLLAASVALVAATPLSVRNANPAAAAAPTPTKGFFEGGTHYHDPSA